MAWRDLYFYWQARQRDGRPPSRADLDPPTQIPRLAPNLMLFDIVDGYFRSRLIGSEITRRAGSDNTGQRLDPRVLEERGIPAFVVLLQQVVDTREPVLYSVERDSQSAFGATGLLLPLSGADGAIDMILGGMFYESSRTNPPPVDWVPGTLTQLSLPDMLDAT